LQLASKALKCSLLHCMSQWVEEWPYFKKARHMDNIPPTQVCRALHIVMDVLLFNRLPSWKTTAPGNASVKMLGYLALLSATAVRHVTPKLPIRSFLDILQLT
jgi:hypothetical protein